MIKKIILIHLLCFFLVSIRYSLAVDIDNFKPTEEIQIEADRIEILKQKNIAYLMGNVFIIQNELKLMADNMNVNYTKKNQNITINKILANSNVKIKDKNIDAKGDIGVYDFINNTITLEKNVVIYDGLSSVYGDKLVYDVLTKTSKIIGGKKTDNQQVHIIIDDVNKVKEYYGDTTK